MVTELIDDHKRLEVNGVLESSMIILWSYI